MIKFFTGLPKQLYWAIGAALALWAVVAWHAGEVAGLKAESYAAGVADTTQVFDDAQAKADREATKAAAIKQAAQDKASKEKTDAFRNDNADIRARADAIRVRREAQGVRDSAPGDQGGTRQAPSGIATAPPCDGLPWSTALPLMLQAQLNLNQLNAVLDWEDAQDAIAGGAN